MVALCILVVDLGVLLLELSLESDDPDGGSELDLVDLVGAFGAQCLHALDVD